MKTDKAKELARIEAALNCIDPATLEEKEWTDVNMACKNVGVSYEVIDAWNQKDPARYDQKENLKRWNSFKQDALGGLQEGTIINIAKRYKFDPKKPVNDYIGEMHTITVKPAKPEKREYQSYKGLDTRGQIRAQIKALFSPEDGVSLAIASTKRGKGGYSPIGRVDKKASELLEILDSEEQTRAFLEEHHYNPQAGAWICVNPTDGKGGKGENITAYKYALIECDNVGLDKQMELINALKLPYKTLIYSGNKSLHAICHIGAVTLSEFKERFNFIKSVCAEHGLTIDGACSDPSRLSRLAGVTRGDTRQTLINVDGGKSNFSEFKTWITSIEQLPDVMSFRDMFESLPAREDMPKPTPEIIEGVLKEKQKMLLSSNSKAGKSFALINLACSMATGSDWIGFKCKKGKVLYINGEIDKTSFDWRVNNVTEARNMDREEVEKNFKYMNLKGRPDTLKLENLAENISNSVTPGEFQAVILDPIYTMGLENENDNSIVARFLANMDVIIRRTGASVIYAHHHSKGSQNTKASIDRASGAGAFARDAETIIDLIELDMPENLEEEVSLEDIGKPPKRAFEMSFTMRELPPIKNFNIFYEWPYHYRDTEGVLDNAIALEDKRRQEAARKSRAKGTQRTKEINEKLSRQEAIITGQVFFENATPWEDSENLLALELNELWNLDTRLTPCKRLAMIRRIEKLPDEYKGFSVRAQDKIDYLIYDRSQEDNE